MTRVFCEPFAKAHKNKSINNKLNVDSKQCTCLVDIAQYFHVKYLS